MVMRCIASRAYQLTFKQPLFAARGIKIRGWLPLSSLFGDKAPQDPIKVRTLEEARALDAADGIIDGKFEGQDIEIEGMGMYVCGVPLTPLHGGMDAVDDCEKAVKEAGNERILVSSIEEAERLDAQDGVIDGKYEGTAIEVKELGLYSKILKSMGLR
jgi:hypothetical protein